MNLQIINVDGVIIKFLSGTPALFPCLCRPKSNPIAIGLLKFTNSKNRYNCSHRRFTFAKSLTKSIFSVIRSSCIRFNTHSCASVIRLSAFAVQFFVFAILPSQVFAQQDSAVHIYESQAIRATMQKRIDYARYTHGVFPGYRIQVNFSQDRNEANKMRNDFSNKFPALPTYLPYQQPYFKLYAGDFRTKLEAVKTLKFIKKDFPTAFVVREKINPPPLQ